MDVFPNIRLENTVRSHNTGRQRFLGAKFVLPRNLQLIVRSWVALLVVFRTVVLHRLSPTFPQHIVAVSSDTP
jgi:hypothetical protein